MFMTEEKNQLNVYNHFEAIKNAVAQLETIHVYELANRQYGTSEDEDLRIKVAELEAANNDLNKQWAVMFDNYNKLCDEHRSSLIQLEKLHAALQDIETAVKREANLILSKLPRFIKKWYGLE